MSEFDHQRFNGFARDGLDDLLCGDLLAHCIFNERDMHAAAYMYIRQYFEKLGRANIYVRCESQINGVRPDVAVYDRGTPVYILEFKMLMDPGNLNEELVYKDLNKMGELINRLPSIKWGFFHLIYDDDLMFKPTTATLRRHGYEKISITSINARRKEESERQRKGYDDWRREFDRLVGAHKQFS